MTKTELSEVGSTISRHLYGWHENLETGWECLGWIKFSFEGMGEYSFFILLRKFQNACHILFKSAANRLEVNTKLSSAELQTQSAS